MKYKEIRELVLMNGAHEPKMILFKLKEPIFYWRTRVTDDWCIFSICNATDWERIDDTVTTIHNELFENTLESENDDIG